MFSKNQELLSGAISGGRSRSEEKFIIDTIGYHGPHILSLLTLSQIWRQTPYLLAFLGGFFVNKTANEWLKELFKQPRPVTMDLGLAQSRDLVFRFRNYMGYAEPDKIYVSPAHVYGMPSGHAQSAGYALGFLYFTKTKQLNTLPITSTLVVVFLTEIWLSAMTMYQRWESRAHTVAQIFLGFLVGGVISGGVYVVTYRLNQKAEVLRPKLSVLQTSKDKVLRSFRSLFMEVLSRKNIA